MREGESAEQAQAGLGGPGCERRAVYELSAVVAHVRDLDEPPGDAATADGHLIAHIRVQSLLCCSRADPGLVYSVLSA